MLREWTHLLGFTAKCISHQKYLNVYFVYILTLFHFFVSVVVYVNLNINEIMVAEGWKKRKRMPNKKQQHNWKEKLVFSIRYPHKSINLVLRCRFCWHAIAPKITITIAKKNNNKNNNIHLKIQKRIEYCIYEAKHTHTIHTWMRIKKTIRAQNAQNIN